MTTKKKKIPRGIVYGILLFIFFAFIFSFFRLQIYTINAWCFAMTGEIQQIQFTSSGDLKMDGDEEKRSPSATEKKPDATIAAPQKTVSNNAILDGKPVKSNLPPTVQPKIFYANTVTEQDLQKSPLFPPLRSFNGTEWKKEKTEIRMTCDGWMLQVSFLCFDSEPSKIITQYSETDGASLAWKDDSIEFFLMKDPKADHYFQYVCSASGTSKVYYYKTSDNPSSGVNESKFPVDFKKPVIRGGKCDEGYRIYMEIDLSNNLGLPKLSSGKDILLQVVRNYRGQGAGNPAEAGLQLYPTFIYADSRANSANNHDRRAFQPAKLVEE
jgi:hypothetical protein